MAEDGINWGGWMLGAGALVTAAILGAPAMSSLSETLLENAKPDSVLTDMAGTLGEWSKSLSSTVAGVATDLGIEKEGWSVLGGDFNYAKLSDVRQAAAQAGSNVLDWASNNKLATGLAVGTTAAVALPLGQWTGKVASGGSSAPSAGQYANYIRTRQQLAAAPTRNA
jgi:hypothetical protein